MSTALTIVACVAAYCAGAVTVILAMAWGKGSSGCCECACRRKR